MKFVINRYILILGFTLFSFAFASAQTGKPGNFKNVIFIVGDDHSAEVIGAYGNRQVRTPNLDKMAARGVIFDKAYVSSPVCAPSRQSLITGRYPHATGVSLLTSSFPENQVTIADYLTPKGYKTALIGKNHFNNQLNHGFELKIERKDYEKQLALHPPQALPDTVKVRPPWKPFKDPAAIWLNAEGLPSSTYDKDQPGTYYANKAIEFIEQNKDNRFLLWLGFEEPHSPFNFPVEFSKKYRKEDMVLPSGSPEDDRWVPEIFKGLTDEEKKGIKASYYSSVEFLDKNIGLVLDAVEKAGLTENTLIVYIGDHGYLLNDHKRFEKHSMWEQAVRAPLIVQGGHHFATDRRVQNLTTFIDLVPTAIDALGEAPLKNSQGKSFLPVLTQSGKKNARDFVFSEYLEDNKAMVRTTDWKYVFTSGKKDLALGYATGYPAPGITHFLYDLKNDPHETHNVAADPANQKVLKALQQKMLQTFQQTHPLGKLPGNLSVDEQLSRYCEPPEAKNK